MRQTDREILVACDALVDRALVKAGNWIVRKSRDRQGIIRGQYRGSAHVYWPLQDEHRIEVLLRDAWDHVDTMARRYGWTDSVDTERLRSLLQEYTRDLLMTGTRHNVGDLAYRLETRAGLSMEVTDGQRVRQTG